MIIQTAEQFPFDSDQSFSAVKFYLRVKIPAERPQKRPFISTKAERWYRIKSNHEMPDSTNNINTSFFPLLVGC